MIATRPAPVARPTAPKGDFSVREYAFEANRIVVSSAKPFPFTLAALENRVPTVDLPELTRLAGPQTNLQGIDDAMKVMVGELGFIRLAKIHQSPFVTLLGKRSRTALYLIANPALSIRVFERDPLVGAYTTVRVSLHEEQGRTHFSYDQPSTLLSQFEDEEIQAVGELLDEKVSALAAYVLR